MKDIELPEPVPCTHFTDEQISKAMDGSGFTLYGAKRGEPLFTADQLRAAVEADRAQRVPDVDALADKIAECLRGTYHCNRVWEAWHVGTMSQDDFEPVDESETPREIAEELAALLASTPAQPAQPWPMEEQPDGSLIPVDPIELPKALADKYLAPQPVERKPMTDEVVREGFAACGVGGINARLGFVEGVKFTERHHGIREQTS